MSRLILPGRILRIQHKGGFIRSHTEKRAEATAQSPVPKTIKYDVSQKVMGGVYLTFICACGRRNKKAMRDMKRRSDTKVYFVCHGCCNLVELALIIKGAPEGAIPKPNASQRTESGLILP